MNEISKLRLQYIFPIGLFIAFCLDGSISYACSSILYRSYSMVPCLSFLWIIFTLFFTDDTFSHLELWSAVVGGLIDWYYVGIWGVLVFVFPLLVYITKWLYKYLTINFLSASIICLVDLLILLFLSSFAEKFADKVAGISPLPGSTFFIYILVPTLLLNLVLFIVLFFPVRYLFNHCQQNR